MPLDATAVRKSQLEEEGKGRQQNVFKSGWKPEDHGRGLAEQTLCKFTRLERLVPLESQQRVRKAQ